MYHGTLWANGESAYHARNGGALAGEDFTDGEEVVAASRVAQQLSRAAGLAAIDANSRCAC